MTVLCICSVRRGAVIIFTLLSLSSYHRVEKGRWLVMELMRIWTWLQIGGGGLIFAGSFLTWFLLASIAGECGYMFCFTLAS